MGGGTEASVGEFPHQIALLRGGVGGSLMCGGSLIAADKVVTAGHCCDGQSASRLGVRVGNHHLYSDDPDQKDIAVSRVNLHPDYDSWLGMEEEVRQKLVDDHFLFMSG